MELAVGSIVTGKVTCITKFGAFVNLMPGKSGLVHISEIADRYVSDVNEFLTVGQEVSVKVLSIDESGRINLSIKAAAAENSGKAVESERRSDSGAKSSYRPRERRSDEPVRSAPKQPEAAAEPSFEDKLRRFMQDSDSKMSGLRQYTDQRSRRRGR